MTLSRRIISGIAATLLATSLLPTAAIAEVSQQATSADQGASATEAQAQAEEADSAIAETSEEVDVDVAMATADAATAAADTAATAADAASASALSAFSASATKSGDLADIDYVYIDAESVSTDSAQYVLVGFESVPEGFESSALTISSSNGKAFVKSPKGATDDAVLFEFAAGSLAVGTYNLLSLDIAQADSKLSYDFTTDVCEYEFSVTSSSATIESALAEGGIYTIDASGNVVEQDNVEQALAAAGAVAGGKNAKGKYSAKANMTILLDPGHGGTDPGASANGLIEKDLNLKIAKACYDELNDYKDVTIRMTRTSDTTVSLEARAKMAQTYGASVVVGIHNDSAVETAHGSSVIVPLDGREHEIGDAMGKSILNELKKLGLNNRGTWGKAGSEGEYYYMIREPKKVGIPGIIIEHAFLTNANNAAFLSNDANLRKMGVADATGIAKYYGLTKEEFAEYAPIYDHQYYLENNPDVEAAYYGNRTNTLMHFLTWGMKEGRKSSPNFDVVSYYNLYPDLRNAFGYDLEKYYLHYLNGGRYEDRSATGTTELANYATTYNGRDYAPVYDGSVYRHNYGDLDAAFTRNVGHRVLFSDKDLLAHFATWGMNEGRIASNDFSVEGYYNAYGDLRNAFGTNLQGYYHHYIDNGVREGRAGSAYAKLAGYRTVADGIDYSSVYDGAYYQANHPDLQAAFTRNIGAISLIDEGALLDHFRSWGMREGRRASKDFDLECYYRSNPDLRHAFGTADWSQYYMHYIAWGKAEGRTAVENDTTVTDKYSAIMGNSEVTPAQMAARYRQSGKEYPSDVYTEYGAPTIDVFCNIVYQEANAEGVRAEIVFAQAMHETGWLQFGGDVSPEQCNFAGIGATGGVPGNSFNDNGKNSVRIGLRAQVQHLKAYASTDKLNNKCVDPRFDLVKRGCAPSVYDLSGRWATGQGYGDKIMELVDSIIAL